MTPAKARATKLKTAPQFSRAAVPAVPITHPDRIVYPDDGITKGDLAAYYELVAERLLAHVADRPLSLVRCPDGMAGPCFFQKHPPVGMSQAVRRIRVREKEGFDTYVTIHDIAGLLTVVQFNAMEIHVWGSKADDIERPDRIVFDLDPGPDVPWDDVVETAGLFRRLLTELGMEAFVKTTGGKGLHIVTAIRPKREWDEVKEFCRNVVQFLVKIYPERYVANMSKAQRRGKIFLDYLRNDRGATWVAPYSTRARPGAPVSMPVDWKELGALKSGDAFTLTTIRQRLRSRRNDPWKNLAKSAASLTDVMFRAVRGR